MGLSVNSLRNLYIVDDIKKDTWKEMVEFFYKECGQDMDMFELETRNMEIQNAEEMFFDEPAARTKSGKWKKTFTNSEGETVWVVHNDWSSAKSHIRSNAKVGLEMMKDGKVLAQTALLNARKEITESKKTTYEKAMASLHQAAAHIRQGGFSAEEADQLNKAIEDLPYASL